MRENIRKIRADADRRCAEIKKTIAQKQVLLDALERGAIEP
jgi:hypothetical protein